MVGVIRKRDVLIHPVVTIQCFGWRVFFRTLVAGRDKTFLSLLMETDFLKAKRIPTPEIVERSIELELGAMRFYERLARSFSEAEAVLRFFQTLAMQEKEHAELLMLCRAAGTLAPWETDLIERFAEALPRLEKGMEDAESFLKGPLTLTEALRLVIQIETSEVNFVYRSIVAASGSSFVRALDIFRRAVQEHLSYIRREIVEIDPGLEAECLAMGQEDPVIL